MTARGVLVVEGDDDVAGIGGCLLATDEQMQQGPVAVPHAVHWQTLWHSPTLVPVRSQLCQSCFKALQHDAHSECSISSDAQCFDTGLCRLTGWHACQHSPREIKSISTAQRSAGTLSLSTLQDGIICVGNQPCLRPYLMKAESCSFPPTTPASLPVSPVCWDLPNTLSTQRMEGICYGPRTVAE